MKINEVKCNHFAGLNNKSLAFKDGLNVVCEDNESGKSTMVDLIYQMLFQPTAGKDSDFISSSFPIHTDGTETTVIDGALSFEDEKDTYKIEKKWNKDGAANSYFTETSGGTLDKDDLILQRVQEILGGSAGMFKEIVFDSKRFKASTLENMFKNFEDKGPTNESDRTLVENRKMTLSEILKDTKDSADGVTAKMILSVIEQRCGYYGANWDYDSDAFISTKGADMKKNGLIAKTKNQLDTLTKNKTKVLSLEDEKEKIYKKMDDASEKAQNTQSILDGFGKVKDRIQAKTDLETFKKELKVLEEVAKDWEENIKLFAGANDLKSQLENAIIKRDYEAVSTLKNEYEEKKKILDSLTGVNPDDITLLENLIRDKESKLSKARGVNVATELKKLGSKDIEIKFLDEEKARIAEETEKLDIDCAVEITVPDVMTLTIAPKDIDINELKKEIADINTEIEKIYVLYDVRTLDALKSKKNKFDSANRDVELAKNKFDSSLTALGKTWETLVEECNIIPNDVKSVDAVMVHINKFCGSSNINAYCGEIGGKINDYKNNYMSPENLKGLIDEQKKKIDKQEALVKSNGEISSEYEGSENTEEFINSKQKIISDLKAEENRLQENLKEINKELGDIREKLMKELDHYDDNINEEINRLTILLDTYKKEGLIWRNLKTLIDAVTGNRPSLPHDDFDKAFISNLIYITGGKIKNGGMNDDLSLSLESGGNVMAYDILSSGTEETVALAFRLAMLKSIFPNDNGFAIFDDPLVNMDDGRRKKSCELIEKFAEKNQVIFITCDSQYKTLMKNSNTPSIK